MTVASSRRRSAAAATVKCGHSVHSRSVRRRSVGQQRLQPRRVLAEASLVRRSPSAARGALLRLRLLAGHQALEDGLLSDVAVAVTVVVDYAVGRRGVG